MEQKIIGLIGGMSWESTASYYEIINEVINQKLGGLHSARTIIYSVDFAEIELCQSEGRWEDAGKLLADAAKYLERAGADFVVLCTNTMHKVAPQIEGSINIPLLHIADVTALELKKREISKVGLLGTKYTMQQEFYKNILAKEGIETVIPREGDIDTVNNIIFNELCHGNISSAAKEKFLHVISWLQESGAKGIVLGCTEIGLLIKQSDVKIPIFDTTILHATAAAEMALEL